MSSSIYLVINVYGEPDLDTRIIIITRVWDERLQRC